MIKLVCKYASQCSFTVDRVVIWLCPDQETSEFQISDHVKITQHLRLEHLKQTIGYFLPGIHCCDVIQHGLHLTELLSLLLSLY